MNSVQLFVLPHEDYSNPFYQSLDYLELDLYNVDPIVINKSIQDLDSPVDNASNFTKTFKVPHTAKNGKFFDMVFNVNSLDFDVTKKSLAYINVNGFNFMSGDIRLINIYKNDKEGTIEYEILFMGETGSFSGAIGPKKLLDLNLTGYAHQLNFYNVVDSWDGNLFNGDILYPLVEYGYTYDQATGASAGKIPDQSTLSFYDNEISTKGFTDISNPLALNQFKPAIKLKVIWDKIFEEANFKYESDFLTSFFDKTYLIATKDASPTLENDQLLSVYDATTEYNGLVSLSGPGDNTKLEFLTVENENPNFSTTDYTYTAQLTSNDYTIRIALDMLADYQSGITGLTGITLLLSINGGTDTAIGSGTINPAIGGGVLTANGNSYIETTISLNLGDVVTFKVYGSAWNYSTLSVVGGYLTIDEPLWIIPSSFIPKDFTQLDFIKSITTKFKLIWEPVTNVKNKFSIEPWINWIKSGEQKNWTDELDEDFDLKIEPQFQSQKRKITFKDADDSDMYNKNFKDVYKKTFGELNIDSDIEIIKGEKKIETSFAPIPLAPIGNYNGFLIPHFAKDSLSKREPITIKPRIFYYNGLQDSGITYYISTDSGLSLGYSQYPLISNFSNYPFDSSSFDLNFQNTKQYWKAIELGFSGRTGKTAYTKYWKAWYESTYNSQSRIMEATFNLDYKDISNLN